MIPKDRLIIALAELCRRQGGHVQVADRIGVNDQTLYQIVAGIKLPSGQPRGVGPRVQRRLEEHFPGWADLGAAPTRAASTLVAREEAAHYTSGWPFDGIDQAAVGRLARDDLLRLEGAFLLAAGQLGYRISRAPAPAAWRKPNSRRA